MRRALAIVAIAASAAACTFVSSLDYLQSGGSVDAGDAADDRAVLPEAGLTPEMFAPGQDVPTVIALDDANVYWYAGGATKAIMRAPKSGGAPISVTPAPDAPSYLYVEKDPGLEIFWTSGGKIFRAPKAGGAAQAVYALGAGLEAHGIAIDEASIYVGAADRNGATYDFSRANRIDGGNRVLLDDTVDVGGVAVDGTTLLWSDGTVVRFAPKTFTPEAGVPDAHYGDDMNDLIAPQSQIFFVVEPNAIFWSDGLSITKNPRAPDVVGTLLFDDAQSTTGEIRGIAVDATYVWFTHAKSAEIRRVPKAAGDAQTVVTKQTNVRGIAVDASHVYFTLQGDGAATGAVLRIPSN